MKKIVVIIQFILLLGIQVFAQQKKIEENWDSIKANYKYPEWFSDAKLGIFIHWGVYSVPAHGSEWYPRQMYQNGSLQSEHGENVSSSGHENYKYQVEKYGPLDKFGYKDFIKDFKAEKFNASEWIQLFKDAGAKYIVPVAEHHDAFAMYNSTQTIWNSVEMGPKRDILKELRDETLKQGLRFGASSHYAFNWEYYNKKPGMDTYLPKYSALYGPLEGDKGVPVNQEFREMWWKRTKEIIDNYQPDVLWFDFCIDKAEFAPQHLKLASYYYNKSLEWNRGGVALQSKNLRYESFPAGTHMLDLERSKSNSIKPYPWQTDTSVGENSWGYITDWKSKNPNTIIDDFIDIISKNGCLLLNVGPKSDGTIPEDQKYVLMELGKWLKVNGEAVYKSRPFKIYGEGPTEIVEGHLSEGKNKDLGAEDIRFTQRDGQLYAFLMDWPASNKSIIKSLALKNLLLPEKIKSVSLVDGGTVLKFKQTKVGLEIDLPSQPTGKYAYVLKIN